MLFFHQWIDYVMIWINQNVKQRVAMMWRMNSQRNQRLWHSILHSLFCIGVMSVTFVAPIVQADYVLSDTYNRFFNVDESKFVWNRPSQVVADAARTSVWVVDRESFSQWRLSSSGLTEVDRLSLSDSGGVPGSHQMAISSDFLWLANKQQPAVFLFDPVRISSFSDYLVSFSPDLTTIHDMLVMPQQNKLILVSGEDNRVLSYQWSNTDTKPVLTQRLDEFTVPGLEGAQKLLASHDEMLLVVGGKQQSSLLMFVEESGQWKLDQTIDLSSVELDCGSIFPGVSDMVFSPSDDVLYLLTAGSETLLVLKKDFQGKWAVQQAMTKIEYTHHFFHQPQKLWLMPDSRLVVGIKTLEGGRTAALSIQENGHLVPSSMPAFQLDVRISDAVCMHAQEQCYFLSTNTNTLFTFQEKSVGNSTSVTPTVSHSDVATASVSVFSSLPPSPSPSMVDESPSSSTQLTPGLFTIASLLVWYQLMGY